MKRFFDLTLSFVGLVLISPLLLALAVWIKLDSAGPVFFRQERIGRYGVPFVIYKLRSMRVNAESSGLKVTTKDDPRITKCGGIFRKYKLDELPQLINVLKGDMSLVGPRPEVADYLKYYPEASKVAILGVRPGITDSAALEFFDEAILLSRSNDPERTYIEDVLPRKIQIYEDYARKHSVFSDLVIIIRTITRLLKAGHPLNR